jgi:PAS domain S-box-containing protein
MRSKSETNGEAQRLVRQRTDDARMRLALDAARMGTWERNLLTGEDFWSEKQEAIFGLAPGSFAATHRSFLDRVLPEDRQAVEDAARKAIEGTGRYDSEYRIRSADGTIRWMAGRGDVVRDDHGRATCMVGVTMDITDRKQAQEDLRVAKEQAEAANAAKDQFLATLSHELRTPLTPVLASVELLGRMKDLPEEVVSSLETIRRNVQMEARIIDDLLDLTRISRGKVELRLETVDAHASLRHALEVWQQQIEEKGLEVTLHLSARRHHVRADPARLQQIFWNLIGNAVKFTPQSGRVTLRSSDAPQNRLVLQVADTGIGIEVDVLPRLFNAFEQGERAVTRHYGGLGLGLSISKALVVMHHGTLTASSDGRGRGATFTLSLDTVFAAPADQPVATMDVESTHKHLSILLVEDHEDTLRVMARLLRSYGYDVSTAGSVRTALDLADAGAFDLLISDLGLPDGSGLDVMRGVRSGQQVPGIALTGFGMEEDVKRSKEAGFELHLTKPINLAMLEAAILHLTS